MTMDKPQPRFNLWQKVMVPPDKEPHRITGIQWKWDTSQRDAEGKIILNENGYYVYFVQLYGWTEESDIQETQ